MHSPVRWSWLLASSVISIVGCEDTYVTNEFYGSEGGASMPEMDAGRADAAPPPSTDSDSSTPPPEDSGRPEPPGEDAASPPEMDAGDVGVDANLPDSGGLLTVIGGLVVNSTPAEQALDLFGVAGHRFWIEVSDEQLELINQGDVCPFGCGGGDIYTPGGMGPENATYADHVVVRDAVSGSVADYGKIETSIIGESTFRQWTPTSIPNVRLDTDQFTPGKRIGTFEAIRLNNGLVGTIFREVLAHRIYLALDYPALRSSWAFLGCPVWGEGTWVPMALMEVYKTRFCDDNQELLGGTCLNMWEFAGDPVWGWPPDACQIDVCDNTRLEEFADKVQATPQGPGFMADLDPFVDWPLFHKFQCMSWILSTGDDALHNSNNNLILERTDGRLVWAPYSIDISAGQDWYPYTPLPGSSTLAERCQSDPECWAGTVAACEELIPRFDALDPELMVDDAVATLTALDMMREGDQEYAEEIRAWYVTRQENLARDLERWRIMRDSNGDCPVGYEECGDGGCGTPEQCLTRQCPIEATWCEATERCVTSYDDCPVCDALNPVLCVPFAVCAPAVDDCTTMCQGMFGLDAVYCPSVERCRMAANCPDVPDGGVPSDGGVDGGGP